MQKPPIPIKNSSKFFKSPDLHEILTTPPKELSLFFQTPISQVHDDNVFTSESMNEKFVRLIQEKNDEIELLKSKLGVSELSVSQLKSNKGKLLNDYEERTSENRLEITKLKSLLEEKRIETEGLNAKLFKYEDLSQENSVLQAKIAEIEFSNKKLINELTKSRELNIEMEAENSLLKNDKKLLENDVKDLKSFEKTMNTQLLRKNEQIESLRRYLNNLEFKFKDLSKINDLEKNLVLTACEIERLQKILSKKTEEIEFLGKKTLEFNKIFKNIANYEKTISNLALENEKLKSQSQKIEFESFQRPEFETKNKEIFSKTTDFSNKRIENAGNKNAKNVLFGEIDRMNGLFRNGSQDFEAINREYQRVMKENIGLFEKMEGFDEEMEQMKMLLKGKEREVQELRMIKKDKMLEKTLKFNDDNDTRRNFTD